jgi:SRSO17 transposase
VGKTANSQVAVFGCLCNGKYASLVDSRLYLPESWSQDASKCDEAGIPASERGFKTKQVLALDIIKHQLSLGIQFDYIGADGLYGNDCGICQVD